MDYSVSKILYIYPLGYPESNVILYGTVGIEKWLLILTLQEFIF